MRNRQTDFRLIAVGSDTPCIHSFDFEKKCWFVETCSISPSARSSGVDKNCSNNFTNAEMTCLSTVLELTTSKAIEIQSCDEWVRDWSCAQSNASQVNAKIITGIVLFSSPCVKGRIFVNDVIPEVAESQHFYAHARAHDRSISLSPHNRRHIFEMPKPFHLMPGPKGLPIIGSVLDYSKYFGQFSRFIRYSGLGHQL